MKLVCLSDTHGYHKKLTIPDGDFLIHVGDFSMRANRSTVCEFARWFKAQPHTHKIIVAGNHDVALEGDRRWALEEFAPAHYLAHERVILGGLTFFGSPFSPAIRDPSDWSFDYPPDSDRSRDLWDNIPKRIDVLITHGPPKGILDRVNDPHPGEDPNVGDVNLLRRVMEIQPRAHIFGHIHEGFGTYQHPTKRTRFFNVSVCDVNYKPTNPITIIDL